MADVRSRVFMGLYLLGSCTDENKANFYNYLDTIPCSTQQSVDGHQRGSKLNEEEQTQGIKVFRNDKKIVKMLL